MSAIEQHQVSAAVTPVAGAALAAALIRANLNETIDAYDAHDADATIHVISGTIGTRPAAPTMSDAWYFTTDVPKRLFYSDGASWTEIDYSDGAPVPNQSDMLFLASTRG